MPVKFRQAQNNLKNRHEDANFCLTTKNYLKDIAFLFCAENMFVVPVDDKAKVPIGVTAATKQSPLVMHFNYDIRLPGYHDFVKATKHELKLSVYATPEIFATSLKVIPKVSYLCPTFIPIGRTTYSHGRDFDHFLESKQFQCVAKVVNEAKPIAMIFSDGRPDENPHFPNALNVFIHHFKEHKFDVLLVSIHAPAMSAYYQVQTQMLPLNKALAGLILPYNASANHLDYQRREDNVDLKNNSFKRGFS